MDCYLLFYTGDGDEYYSLNAKEVKGIPRMEVLMCFNSQYGVKLS